MEYGFFEYLIDFYSDELDGRPPVHIKEKGITYAATFTEAMQILEKRYGEMIEGVTIEGLEPDSCYVTDTIVFNKEV